MVRKTCIVACNPIDKMSASTSSVLYCRKVGGGRVNAWLISRWDFCTAHFRLAADLDAHLQQAHIAHARPEPIAGKRRKIARGVYVVVSEPRLAGEAVASMERA